MGETETNPEFRTYYISTSNGIVSSIIIEYVTLTDSTINIGIGDSCIIADEVVGLSNIDIKRSNDVLP